MRHGRDAGHILDCTEVDECRWLRECSRKRSGSGQLRSPDMEGGCRHRFIATESSDGLAALRMPLQAATPGFFFRGVSFPLVDARLRVVELGGLCRDEESKDTTPLTNRLRDNSQKYIVV
jgi:hypothetical protein